jgi:hypothetical protein
MTRNSAGQALPIGLAGLALLICATAGTAQTRDTTHISNAQARPHLVLSGVVRVGGPSGGAPSAGVAPAVRVGVVEPRFLWMVEAEYARDPRWFGRGAMRDTAIHADRWSLRALRSIPRRPGGPVSAFEFYTGLDVTLYDRPAFARRYAADRLDPMAVAGARVFWSGGAVRAFVELSAGPPATEPVGVSAGVSILATTFFH